MRTVILALALAAAYVAVAYTDQSQEPEAICDTDSDCLRHCPPPADDPDCDGGPQS